MGALDEWARAWGVSPEAIQDLAVRLTVESEITPGHGEAETLGLVRLRASQAGWRVFRNNVGACHTNDGRFIRYGLANDSKRINEALKSSDLIGIRPVRIDSAHLGRVLGQFVALECKRPGWVFTGGAREQAQQDFLSIVDALGGYARFTTGGIE